MPLRIRHQPDYGSEVPCKSLPGSGQGFVAVSASVGSLSPATTYHFRIVAKNSFGEGEGSDRTFTTGAVLPEVTPQAASEITQTTATLNGTVNPLGLKVTACRFEYGRTTTYEAAVPCSAMPGEGHSPTPVTAEISELLPGRSYHFRIVASNSEGTSTSADASLVTVAEPPVSVTESALALGSGSETLIGAVAPNGTAITTCRFEYGTSPAGILEASVPCSSLPADPEEGAAVSAFVSGLAAATTYHYRLVTSSAGGTSYGDTLTFTTVAAKLPGGGLEEPLEGHVQPGPGLPTLASHKLSVNSHGSLEIPVKCPAGSSTCAGTISLQVVKAAGASSHRRHGTKHHVLVAVGTFKVFGGRVTTVRLRLSHTAKKLLRRSHVLHASATITPAAGKAARTAVTIRSG